MSDVTLPEKLPTRRYDYLYGEQFFTDPYKTGYEAYTSPYLAGGTSWEDLATQYTGIPVVSGYYDEEGNFVPERSLYNQAQQLYNLRQTTAEGVPSFQDYITEQGIPYQQDLTQTAPYQGIESLITGLTDTDTLMAQAEAEAAKALGFINQDGSADIEGYRASKAGMQEQLAGGVMGQRGVMGTEYETAARRSTQARVESLMESNRQIIEGLGLRSSAAAYNALDQVSSQINDIMLESDMKLLEQDLLMRQVEYEALAGRYNNMVTQGMAAGEQYIDMMIENRMGALQAYAAQLDTIVANNQQAFQQYEGELQRIEQHASMVYNNIMAEIGYDQAQMQMAEDKYNQYMTPYYDALEAALIEAQINDLQEPEEPSGPAKWASLGAGLTGGATIGATIGSAIPIVGTAGGAIIGGVLGLFIGGLVSIFT